MSVSDLWRQTNENKCCERSKHLEKWEPESLDLIRGGSFENKGLKDANFTFNGQKARDWKSNSGGIETWASGHSGVASRNGGDFIELDKHADTVDAIWQDVSTEPSTKYLLKFDATERPNQRAKGDGVEVYWNEQCIATVRPNQAGVWNAYEFEVTGTGGLDRLEFREIVSENNSYGPLLDEISLKKRKVQDEEGRDVGTDQTSLVADLSGITNIALQLATLSRQIACAQLEAEKEMAPAKAEKSVSGKGA